MIGNVGFADLFSSVLKQVLGEFSRFAVLKERLIFGSNGFPRQDSLCCVLRDGGPKISTIYEGLPEESQPSKGCSLQPQPCGVAAGSYNAALDLSHTALRAESEGRSVQHTSIPFTLAFGPQ